MQSRTEPTSAPATAPAGRISPDPHNHKSDSKGRTLPSLLTGLLLMSILLLYMVTYQVRFTEVAVVRTFGKIAPGNIKTKPGLYPKWPFPIQRVDKFDNRLQVSSTTGAENPTKDGKNIIVTTAINWRIDDPYRFSIRCSSMEDAETKLKTRVRNDQTTVIGSYEFSQFVSTNPEELLYDEITRRIEELVRASAKDLYGIDVVTVKLEAIALPQRITENVFEAMKKDRQAEAARYTSEGESAAATIRTTAQGIADTIKSFADRQAAVIVAEGQRRALENNKILSQDQELASFLLLVRSLPQILKDRTTVIIDADSAGFSPLISDKVPSGPSGGSPTGPSAAATSRPAETTSNVALPEIIQVQ